MKTQEQITKNMKAVKSKNTQIEIILRKELWKSRLFYRKTRNDIFGKPDIVFKGIKLAVFCDSEFWHGYQWQEKAKAEHKSNQEFWYKKIERNIERDKEVNETLKNLGWTVLRFWGKEIEKDTKKCADTIEHKINELKTKAD
jgi:DNA mismatch endonuclease (patch repair protein)